MMDFQGRVIVVTGAGRGIGRAHAKLLASRGAAVVVCDIGSNTDGLGRSGEPANRVVAEITSTGGSAVACVESVAEAAQAEAIVRTAMDSYGHLDAVINNAGIFNVSSFEDTPIDTYDSFLAVHYFGTLHLCRAAWPHLILSGTGRIVNTVSGAMLGVPQMVHYGSSKGAIYGLTRNLAVAGSVHGIRVNAIAPGAGTRMVEKTGGSLPPGMVEYMMASMPPDMIAPVAAYLVHPSCEITGEVLNVAGGAVSRMVMMNTPGIVTPDLTPEVVAERLHEIMDTSEAQVAELLLGY